MNRNIMKALGIVAAAVALFGSFVVTANASDLSKLGNAIQYSTRKGAENLSKAAHKTTNSKSVDRDRNTKGNYVVKPNGTKIFKSTTRHHHRHRYPRVIKKH